MITRTALYWTLVVATSALMLAGASMAASGALRSGGHREITTADGVGMYRGRIRHKVSNTHDGRAIFSVDGIRPGWAGRQRMVLSNVGPAPFGRVTLTQDLVDTGGFSDALQLQVYDVSAKRCLYPRQDHIRRRVARREREPINCERWMPWDGQRQLRFMVVPGKDGTTTWKRREQHLIFVRWRLAADSPNSDQGRSASFRLRWNASA